MSADTAAPLLNARSRQFRVVWQNPESRAFVDVGRLSVEDDGFGPIYRFSYGPGASTDPRFRPFPEFPELDREHRSDGELFAFFANRVMSPQRPDFEDYLDALGLVRDFATPVEMLARSAGGRATDTIQVVPEPLVDAQGNETRLFLVNGVRHVPGASERIAGLRRGDRLDLRDEPGNDWNPRALLLDHDHEKPVGYVPDYLLDYVHKHREVGHAIEVRVEKANGPDVPSHVRLLCSMRVEVAPA